MKNLKTFIAVLFGLIILFAYAPVALIQYVATGISNATTLLIEDLEALRLGRPAFVIGFFIFVFSQPFWP